MQSSLNNLTALAKKGPTFSREFDALVRAIGECKSKAEEDSIISKEVEILKPRLKDPKMDKRWLKELLIRLIYVEMLGHDASWAHVKALQACSETGLITKKVAYLASSLFLDYKSDTIILVVNTLSTDLKSDNYLVVCTALTAICKLISPDLINAVLPRTIELLTHPRELVRKKAVMALHRYHQLDPEHDGPLSGTELDRHFKQALCDKDPSVMSAALCALHEAIARDGRAYKNLIPSFVSILKQVTEHRLPKGFDYHRTPAPFIQVKLLRILGMLGASDKPASDNMYAVVAEAMRKGNTGHTIGNAIVYEAVRTITAIYPNPSLLQSAAEMIANFLKSSSHNLKYVGIDGLARIVRISPKYAAEHQLAVIDCLEDPDETLKRKTLELLYKMTKANNVEVIVEKMIDYLRNVSDEVIKADVVQRIGELVERFAPDTQWFIDTMNQVFELGGEVVQPALAHSLMRLIAEGAGEDDEQADAELRGQAVQSYLELLEKPKLPQVLLQVICWVLGEYGTCAGASAQSVIDKLAAIIDAQGAGDTVRGYLIVAFTKLCAQNSCQLTEEAEVVLHDALISRNTELQQRALELQALLSGAGQARAAALPQDASCEDVEVDVNLSFLNNFVNQALQTGAASYLTPEQRFQMGIVRPSHRDEAADHSHALRFTAYERTAAPAAAAGQAAGGRGSPAFGQRDSPVGQAGSAAATMPAPAAAPPGPPAPVSSEPQLRPAGARKWGPASFSAAPAAAPAASGGPRAAASTAAGAPAHAAPSAYTVAAAAAAAAAADHVPSQKELLAQSLFGEGGGASRGQRARHRAAATAAASARPAQAPTQPRAAGTAAPAAPAAADLLMQLDAPAHTPPVQAPAAPQAASSDPFAVMAGLSVPPPAQQQAPALMDLNALYGAPAPLQHQQPAADLLGGLSQPAQPVPGAFQMPMQGMAAMAPPAAQQPPPVPGTRAMAPRGNAAVEQAAARRDPFADLLG